MNDYGTRKWSNEMSLCLNCQEHIIPQSNAPKSTKEYEVLFYVKPRRGIASSYLTSKQIANIETEKPFEEIINIVEENLSCDHTENIYSKGKY